MKYNIVRTEFRNNKPVETVLIGSYDTYDKADDALVRDVSDFREIHDNDERVDWNCVNVYDDIGNCNRFEWKIHEDGEVEQNEKDTGKYLYVATVIDHGETCNGHVRNLAQGSKEECERAIDEDKEVFARGLMSSTFEDDAITKDDFCVKADEIWYAPNGENDFTNGRIYDLLVVKIPNGKEGK